MADAFPVDVAQIVALFLESIFYGEYLSCFVVILYVTEPSRTPGIYLVSFGMCMYLMLVKAPSRQGRRNVFLVVALLLFVFATLDVVLLLVHVLHAFIWYHGPGGAIVLGNPPAAPDEDPAFSETTLLPRQDCRTARPRTPFGRLSR